MLRFSFMEQVLGPSACIHFLRNFGTTVESYIAELEAFAGSHSDSMPLSGRLALESGIRGYRSLHEWTEYALDAYRQLQSHPSSRPAKSNQGGSS